LIFELKIGGPVSPAPEGR